jgi:hypothetical protein
MIVLRDTDCRAYMGNPDLSPDEAHFCCVEKVFIVTLRAAGEGVD